MYFVHYPLAKTKSLAQGTRAGSATMCSGPQTSVDTMSSMYSSPTACSEGLQHGRHVSFSDVQIREYPVTMSPSCRHGPAIELSGWDYTERPSIPVPNQQPIKKNVRELFLPIPVRIHRLQQLHYSNSEILRVMRKSEQAQPLHSHLSPTEFLSMEWHAWRRATRLRRALHHLQQPQQMSTNDRMGRKGTTTTALYATRWPTWLSTR